MLKLIVCVDKNNAIGKQGELGFRLPSDLRNFQKLTTGNIVVYGSKTIQSMGGKPLPNRKNIMHTRNRFKSRELLIGSMSIDLLIKSRIYEYADVFICGGGEVYKEYLMYHGNLISEIIITRVDAVIEGADTYFPHDKVKWDCYSNVTTEQYNEKGLDYTISHYKL